MDKCLQLWTLHCDCLSPGFINQGRPMGLLEAFTQSASHWWEAHSLDVRLLAVFIPSCDGCDSCHGVRLEISILRPKVCHPEHNQKRKKQRKKEKKRKKIQRIVISSVRKRTQGYHDTDVYKIELQKRCVVLVGKANAGLLCYYHRPPLRNQGFSFYKTKTDWGKYGESLKMIKLKKKKKITILVFGMENLKIQINHKRTQTEFFFSIISVLISRSNDNIIRAVL